jgi:hypothetical protein
MPGGSGSGGGPQATVTYPGRPSPPVPRLPPQCRLSLSPRNVTLPSHELNCAWPASRSVRTFCTTSSRTAYGPNAPPRCPPPSRSQAPARAPGGRRVTRWPSHGCVAPDHNSTLKDQIRRSLLGCLRDSPNGATLQNARATAPSHRLNEGRGLGHAGGTPMSAICSRLAAGWEASWSVRLRVVSNWWRLVWALMGLLALVVMVASTLWYVLATGAPGTASTLVSGIAAVLVPAGYIAVWLWARRESAQALSSSSLDRAADLLAEHVRVQWSTAAVERRLVQPAPIPVCWRWSNLPVTSPPLDAVGDDTGWRRFAPLPGLPTVSAMGLRQGKLKDLLGIYGGLDSGRMVILGVDGAGKTGAAIRLLLYLDAPGRTP